MSSNIDVVKKCVSESISLINIKDISGNTPLHVAVLADQTERVRYFSNIINNIDEPNKFNNSALAEEILNNFNKSAMILIQNSADINIKCNDVRSIFAVSIDNNNVEILKILLSRKVKYLTEYSRSKGEIRALLLKDLGSKFIHIVSSYDIYQAKRYLDVSRDFTKI